MGQKCKRGELKTHVSIQTDAQFTGGLVRVTFWDTFNDSRKLIVCQRAGFICSRWFHCLVDMWQHNRQADRKGNQIRPCWRSNVFVFRAHI